MSPLERRCRHLLWLLPAAERRRRGEELVGVLSDVSAGRNRPSRGEVAAVVWLALTLRLQAARKLSVIMLSALLVAYGTTSLGMLIDLHTGTVLGRDARFASGPFLVDLGLALVPLAATVAWLVGAIRTALAFHSVMLLTFGYLAGREVWTATHGGSPFGSPTQMLPFLAVPVLILALLVAAWRLHWSPPRPRLLWLLLVPACVAAWIGLGAWGRVGFSVLSQAWTATAIAVMIIGAVTAGWLLRSRPWYVVATGAVVGGAVGLILIRQPAVSDMLLMGTFIGLPYTMALLLAAIGAPAHLLADRITTGRVRSGR